MCPEHNSSTQIASANRIDPPLAQTSGGCYVRSLPQRCFWLQRPYQWGLLMSNLACRSGVEEGGRGGGVKGNLLHCVPPGMVSNHVYSQFSEPGRKAHPHSSSSIFEPHSKYPLYAFQPLQRLLKTPIQLTPAFLTPHLLTQL